MRQIRFSIFVIKIFIKNQIQNRNYLLLDMFNIVARFLILSLIYSYVFKTNGKNINGINYETAIWSMFIYFSVITLNLRNIYKIIMDDVKSGAIEIWINKPKNYIFYNFCKVIGQGLYSFLIISVLGSAFMRFFIKFPTVVPVIFIPTFLITFILGQLLALIIYSIIGLMSFFIQDVRPIYWIIDKSIMILGGSYLPLSMFPNFMKSLAYYSPFGAVNFTSSTVLTSWNTEYVYRLLLQFIWIITLTLLLLHIYKKAKNKLEVNGG